MKRYDVMFVTLLSLLIICWVVRTGKDIQQLSEQISWLQLQISKENTLPLPVIAESWDTKSFDYSNVKIDAMISCYSWDIMWDYCMKTFDWMASNTIINLHWKYWTPTIIDINWKKWEYCNEPVYKDEFWMSVEDFEKRV